jgi:hypothetical protein
MYRGSPELPGPFLQGWDFVHDDAHPNDDNGHGTMVATLAAGLANNTAGSAGIAGCHDPAGQGARLPHGRPGGQHRAGHRFAADHGANVINLSLGFPPVSFFEGLGFTHPEINDMFRPLKDAIQYAQRRGAIIVAAAGNFHADEVSLPAAYPGVIAVGATGFDDFPTSYTSSGQEAQPHGSGRGLHRAEQRSRARRRLQSGHQARFRSDGSLANPDSFGVFRSSAPRELLRKWRAVALLASMGIKSQGRSKQARSARPRSRCSLPMDSTGATATVFYR